MSEFWQDTPKRPDSYRTAALMRRILSKADRTGDCWDWTGSRTAKGYGYLRLGKKIKTAHRLVALIRYGSPIPGAQVLHSCDNPGCVRPSHLRYGSHGDNMRDKAMRGRSRLFWGETHPSSRLTQKQVDEIRALLARGDRQVDIAKLFGVSQPTVSAIRVGRIWNF